MFHGLGRQKEEAEEVFLGLMRVMGKGVFNLKSVRFRVASLGYEIEITRVCK